jgi:hypothetical protein
MRLPEAEDPNRYALAWNRHDRRESHGAGNRSQLLCFRWRGTNSLADKGLSAAMRGSMDAIAWMSGDDVDVDVWTRGVEDARKLVA